MDITAELADLHYCLAGSCNRPEREWLVLHERAQSLFRSVDEDAVTIPDDLLDALPQDVRRKMLACYLAEVGHTIKRLAGHNPTAIQMPFLNGLS